MKKWKRTAIMILCAAMLLTGTTGCGTRNIMIGKYVLNRVEEKFEDLMDKLADLFKILDKDQVEETYDSDDPEEYEGNDSSYAGDWKATSCEYMGISLDISEIFDSEVLISLYADGTAAFLIDGSSEEGSWEETENGVSISSYMTIEAINDGAGRLTVEYEGVKIFFEKQ